MFRFSYYVVKRLDKENNAGHSEQQEICIAEPDISLCEVDVATPDAEEPCEYASNEDAEVN